MVEAAAGGQLATPVRPKSDIHGLDHHPVVHVAYSDALAYAQWAGKVSLAAAVRLRVASEEMSGAEMVHTYVATMQNRVG